MYSNGFRDNEIICCLLTLLYITICGRSCNAIIELIEPKAKAASFVLLIYINEMAPTITDINTSYFNIGKY